MFKLHSCPQIMLIKNVNMFMVNCEQVTFTKKNICDFLFGYYYFVYDV